MEGAVIICAGAYGDYPATTNGDLLDESRSSCSPRRSLWDSRRGHSSPRHSTVRIPRIKLRNSQNSSDRDSSGQSATDWQRELLAWRAQRATSLQAPEGWLSLVALGWLKEGDNSFGSAEDSRVQIAGKVPAHVATGATGKRHAALAASAPRVFRKSFWSMVNRRKNRLSWPTMPTSRQSLRSARITIIVIHRDDRYALRVKDLQAADPHRFPWIALV